jgi:hypothetical protein
MGPTAVVQHLRLAAHRHLRAYPRILSAMLSIPICVDSKYSRNVVHVNWIPFIRAAHDLAFESCSRARLPSDVVGVVTGERRELTWSA